MIELLTEILKLINGMENRKPDSEEIIRIRMMLDSVIRKHLELTEICYFFMNKLEEKKDEKSIARIARGHNDRLLSFFHD